MCGQLQDAGNTTTLAHDLDLLKGAGFLCGIQKYAGQKVRRRASSPKLQVMNNALLSAMHGGSFEDVQNRPEVWERWVESSAGAWLVNQSLASGIDLYYWRHRSHEVDVVLERGDRLTAIEIKSGARNRNSSGMSAFKKEYPNARLLLVGGDGIPLEDFMTSPVTQWL
jgi:predicted AAA+ superfamily ATPase